MNKSLFYGGFAALLAAAWIVGSVPILGIALGIAGIVMVAVA